MSEVLSYVPLPKNREFHLSKADFKLLNGAYGCGKTTAMLWGIIDVSMKYPGIKSYVCRKFNEDVISTTRKIFYRECPADLIDFTEGGGKVCYLVNGSSIEFGGLYTRQKQRLKIPVTSVIGVDELAEIDEEDFTDLIGRRRGDFTAKEHEEGIKYPLLFMAASNPPNYDHWMYKKWVTEKNSNYALFEASMYDNPYLSPDYVKTCEQEYGKYESLFRRYVLGRWGASLYGTPVYKGFKREITDEETGLRVGFHVRNLKYIPDKPLLVGIDFGFVRPCASICQFDARDRFMVLETIIGDRIKLRPFAEELLKHINETYKDAKKLELYCDIEGSYNTANSDMTETQILESVFGKERTPRYMKTNVLHGVDLLQQRIDKNVDGLPALMVHKENMLAIEMFETGYVYEKDAKGKGHKEEPAKDGFWDNVADSIRYIINFFYKVKDADGDRERIRCPEPSFITNERPYGILPEGYFR